jgi:Protein of unknown function (DUF3102)
VTTAIDRSNSLTDLAARIRTEHAACQSAVQRGLEHAVQAGKLLIEAKEQLPHGQWLPWLREHCGIPERSAQRYIGIASHAADGKSASLADLTIGGADTSDAAVIQAINDGDVDGFLQRCLDAPFTAADCDDHDRVMLKLQHQLKIPPSACFCINAARIIKDDGPAWRLCPVDDLWETAKLLAPVVNHERKLLFDFETFNSMRDIQNGIAIVHITAGRLIGGIFTEMEELGMIIDGAHKPLSDEQYEKEWKKTARRVMRALEKKLAAAQ